MTNPLLDYYRCPVNLSPVAVEGELSDRAGYFTFDGVVGYGRVAGVDPSATIAEPLPDLTGFAHVDPGCVGLPFDLAEAITNLREERYTNGGGGGMVARISGTGLSRSIYYLLRPMLTVAVRKHLQRIRLNGWEKIPFPSWPLDTSVDRLMSAALKLAMESTGQREVPFIWFWPDGATGAAILTHDVESPAGLAFCDRLMDLDEEAGLKASFQLVPEIRYKTSQAAFDRIRQRGFEGNIHDLNHDGHLFDNREQFLERARQINRHAAEFGARGFRSACMYREQGWFEAFDVEYDMSVPNVAHLEPQRGGCCTAFPYMVGNLTELPLTTIQDYSLFHILGDYSIELWKRQIELILANHGLVTILTHPDYLIEPRAQQIYRDLLAYLRRVCNDRNVWHALPGEVARWWRDRSRMSLVRCGGAWVVEGPGHERARIEYATLDGDRLVYSTDRRVLSV